MLKTFADENRRCFFLFSVLFCNYITYTYILQLARATALKRIYLLYYLGFSCFKRCVCVLCVDEI